MAPLVERLLDITRGTYGGAPAVLILNLLQISLLFWVMRELARAKRERETLRDETVLKIRSARRAELWQERVRPIVLTLMLLGPGLGLAMSTLVGALGMGSLGDAMGSQLDQQALMSAMGGAYREISYAYLLMVGGTLPMLLGPIIVLMARRFDRDAHAALGGENEDRQLLALERIVELLEHRTHAEVAR